MQPFATRLPMIAAGGFVALVVAVCSGCSADKGQPVKKTTPEVKHVNVQVAAVQKAKSFKVAFDNPKMGECPVCGDPVNYESFVAIGHKCYAVCSDECANKLENDPKRYLAAAQP